MFICTFSLHTVSQLSCLFVHSLYILWVNFHVYLYILSIYCESTFMFICTFSLYTVSQLSCLFVHSLHILSQLSYLFVHSLYLLWVNFHVYLDILSTYCHSTSMFICTFSLPTVTQFGMSDKGNSVTKKWAIHFRETVDEFMYGRKHSSSRSNSWGCMDMGTIFCCCTGTDFQSSWQHGKWCSFWAVPHCQPVCDPPSSPVSCLKTQTTAVR